MKFIALVFASLFLYAPSYADAIPTLPFKVPVEIIENLDAEAEREKELSATLEALLYERATSEATEDMRDYAFLALVVSVMSSFFLLYTLYLNSRAASASAAAVEAALDANKIARDELRPWVSLERDPLCTVHFTNHGFTVWWNFNFSNLGRTPAYDVKLYYKAIKRQHLMGIPKEVSEFSMASIENKNYFRTPIIFPGQKTDFLKRSMAGLSYLPNKESIITGKPMLLVCITYRLEQTGNRYGVEGRIFGFKRFDVSSEPFQTRMLEHGEARFIA